MGAAVGVGLGAGIGYWTGKEAEGSTKTESLDVARLLRIRSGVILSE